jgi:TolA-binding protein
MKNTSRINYFFLLLSIGIVSTILSNPILGQTQNNSQNQTAGAGPYITGKPGIESAQELESITNDTQTSVSNDTTPMFQQLGKETQSGNQTEQQQGNETATGEQQQGNETATGEQQQGNETATGEQQQGNETEEKGILEKLGEAVGLS